jgi:hypothetical protein
MRKLRKEFGVLKSSLSDLGPSFPGQVDLARSSCILLGSFSVFSSLS